MTRQNGVEASASQLLVVTWAVSAVSALKELWLLLICTPNGAVVPLESRRVFAEHIHSNQSMCIFFFLSNRWSFAIFSSNEISTNHLAIGLTMHKL